MAKKKPKKCPPCPCAKKRKKAKARPASVAKKPTTTRVVTMPWERKAPTSGCRLQVMKLGPHGGSHRVKGARFTSLVAAKAAAKSLSATHTAGTYVTGRCGNPSDYRNTVYIAFRNGRERKD